MKENNEGKVNQYEFRQAMLSIGVKSDRITMDRVYLFFQRFNVSKDDSLKFNEFSEAICPVNERMAFRLKARQVSNFASRSQHIFEQDLIDQFIKMMELALEMEVSMETMR
jgi:Ca2+-binding EF-hand superfamily protein